MVAALFFKAFPLGIPFLLFFITTSMTYRFGFPRINRHDARSPAGGRRKYSLISYKIKEELCRIFNTPPPIVGDLQFGTFSNTETLIRWFAQNTLSPWIKKVEAEFTRSVFGASRDTHRLEIDLSGLMRGDPQQRWAAWEIAVKNNILTADEVRAEEGWNPKPVQKV